MKPLKKLLREYRIPGGDDSIADHLKDEGESAKTELIRLLGLAETTREEAGFASHLLDLHFRSPESTAAIDRYASTIEDARARDLFIRMREAMIQPLPPLPDIWEHMPEHLRKLCELRDHLPEHIRKRLPKPPQTP